MHQSSFQKMQDFRAGYLQGREGDPLKILDLGSQDVNGSYRAIFDPPGWQYIGVDQEAGPNVDVVLADPYQWREFRSSTIDVVISGQALEHTAFFWRTMEEIERILVPEGLACVIAPSSGPEHRYPLDCWRFYPDGMSAMAAYAGLETVHTQTDWGDADYPDDSNVWHDSMLIARKPRRTPLQRLERWIKRTMHSKF